MKFLYLALELKKAIWIIFINAYRSISLSRTIILRNLTIGYSLVKLILRKKNLEWDLLILVKLFCKNKFLMEYFKFILTNSFRENNLLINKMTCFWSNTFILNSLAEFIQWPRNSFILTWAVLFGSFNFVHCSFCSFIA